MNGLKMCAVIAFSILIHCACDCAKLDYSELEELGVGCPYQDSCAEERVVDTIRVYKCECGEWCINRRTCCIDSQHVESMLKTRPRGTCYQVPTTSHDIMAVTECNPKWQGSPDVKSMCENPKTNLRDPVSQVPVVNLRSETTYRNYYCAICNNDTQFLKFWEIKINQFFFPENKDIEEENFLRHMVFNENYDQWELRMKDENDVRIVPVSIGFALPSNLSNTVIPCVHDLVSDCAADWEDENVSWMCHSYMALVYLEANGTVLPFRNIHCAICNNVIYPQGEMCLVVPATAFEGGKPALSFTLLLDVNLSDGDKVGEINPCGQGEMFDPFFKKCRALVCALPGYTIKDNKCVAP